MHVIALISSIGLLAVALGGCISVDPYQSVTSGPKATVRISTNFGNLGLIVIKPDADCEFKKLGRTIANAQDSPVTTYMPPGRAYFSVNPDLPYTTMRGQGVSFVLEEGQEYLVEFKRLGTSASWHGSKMEFEYNYLNTSGEFPVPVVTDNYSICEREQASS